MAKNIYIGVDNVARKGKQPFIGVDGVARKVKNGFIGVDNVARQFFSGGTPLSSLAVGTSVYLNESGVAQEYIVVNQGIPSGSSLYDSSCNGTWLLRKYVSRTIRFDGDSDGGASVIQNSDINTYMNSTFLSLLDGNIQNAIKQVKIPYANYLGTGNGANGYSCKIFPLSWIEVGFSLSDWGGNTHQAGTDGAVLSYFNGASNDKRIAYIIPTSTKTISWWLRSAYVKLTHLGCPVEADGSLGMANAYDGEGFRPALIMPFDTLIDKNMNIIT